MAQSILLAHSDPEEASRLQQALSEAGMEVWLCRDAMSTLARIKKAKPDALVLADDLPDASGFDLCDSVRRKSGFSAIGVIVLVAPAGEPEADAHRERGHPASAYLPRPANALAVVDQVRTLVKPAEPPPAPPPLPRTGPPPPPPPDDDEPPRAAAGEGTSIVERPSGAFEGLPELPPLPRDVPLPELPPLPPPNPLAEGDPFAEPADARPPKGGSPDDKVQYFRNLVKSRDETLTRARGVYAAKQQEVLTLREQVRLREQQLADLHQAREKDLLVAVRHRELAFLDHLRIVREEGDRLRSRTEAEGRDERKLLTEKQRKELVDREAQVRQLQVALEEAQGARTLALEQKAQAEKERGNANARLEALQQRTNQLEQTVGDAVQERDEASRGSGQLQEQLRTHQRELEGLAGAKRNLEEENAGLGVQLADLQSRLDELADTSRSNLAAIHHRADELETQLEETTQARQVAEKSLATTQQELDAAQAERDARGKALAAAQDEVDSLTQSRSDLEHRLQELTAAHEKQTAEHAAVKKELEAERRAHNAVAVAEIDAREQLEEQTAALAQARAEAADRDRARAAAEEERDAQQLTIAKLGAERARLEEQVDELDAEAKALERSAAESDEAHEKALAELGEQRAALERSLAEKDASLEVLHKHDDELSQQVITLREKLEIEELQTRALESTRAELAASQAKRGELEKGAEVAEGRIRELQGRLERGEAEVRAAREASEAAETAQGKINELRARLREAEGLRESLEQQLSAQKARAEAAQREAKAKGGSSERLQELEQQLADHEESARQVADAQEQERREADWELAQAEDVHRDLLQRHTNLEDELAASQARVRELEETAGTPDPRTAGLEGEVERLRGEVERLKRESRASERRTPEPARATGNGKGRATTLEAPEATHELASTMDEAPEDHTTIGPAPLPPGRGAESTRRRVPEAPRRGRPAPVETDEGDAEEEAPVEHTTIAPAPVAPERKRDRETTIPKGRQRGRSRR